MTQPDTLHTRLHDEIDRRLAVARAATPGEWRAMQYGIDCEIWSPEMHWVSVRPVDHWGPVGQGNRNTYGWPDMRHIALHDPADAIRRYEGELATLERHTPETFADTNLPEMLDLDPDQPWCRTCRGNYWPCADLRSLAHRLGVSVDG